MLKVAVDTKLPQQEGFDNELTKFRDHIQQGIEQELHKIGDVKIVDKETKEWIYYTEVTFSLGKTIENPSQSVARITAQIVNDKGLIDAHYDSVFVYTIDRLSSVYIGFVDLFNDYYLQKVRN